MPQELHVLCCYACKMFQVDIVKKSKKWQCKICNEKQSVQRVYFQGTGKACRTCVQKLNTIAHTLPEVVMHTEESTDTPPSHEEHQASLPSRKVPSKWTKYLDSSAESTESDIEKAATSSNIGYKQSTVEVESSKHLDIDYTVADGVFINESHDNTSSYINEGTSKDICTESEEICNVSIHSYDKLSQISQYATANVELEKGKSASTIKTKSIFDNGEDIDCALDF